MQRPSFLICLALLLLVLAGSAVAADRPNILVILADDLGYADVGFNGCRDIPTPHLDSLARSGLRCTNGYVTHPFCSPTRAGLLTGRYQQRFGHGNNPAWLPDDANAGLPLSQTTLPAVLKTAGYRTACVGKWHLGAHPTLHPNRRGFDDYFGLLGGGHVYLAGARGGVEYSIPLDRNGQAEPLEGYLTDVLGREAARYIEQSKSKSEPWFLYLAFNAPHTPLQATPALMERVRHVADETRRGYAGLLVGLDDAVGRVTAALQDSGQADRTLVFFLSDNGGPISVTHSNNTPLRGAKGQVLEGGIRVPFVVSWPGRIPAGQDYVQPVVSLDVFATAAALAAATVPATHALDGVDLLPFLTGERVGAPHEHLFWRSGGGQQWAVRSGNHKLIGGSNQPEQLYDLAADVSELRDLSAQQPEVAARLKTAFTAWNQDNVTPRFESPRGGQQRPAARAAANSPLAASGFRPTAQNKFVPANSKLELLYNDGDFTEGPVLAADNAILFSDIGDRILRFDPQSSQTAVFREPSGRANGLMFDSQGRLLAAEGANTGGQRRISITETDGTVRTLADRFEGKRFNSPNDLAVDRAGRVYFTDPRYVGDEPRELDFEAVFLVHSDGKTVIATREVTKPNGILVSPDGKTVYVAESDSRADGPHRLLAFNIATDGTLTGKRVLHDFGINRRGIDGMTLDREGNIYATAGRDDLAGIYVFSPTGEHLAFAPTPGDPTNCVFGGGADSTTLYITAAGPKPADGATRRYALYRIRLTHTGHRLFP